jgi:hypothetical protein
MANEVDNIGRWPVNERGEVVYGTGIGTDNVVAYLPIDQIPINPKNQLTFINAGIVISSAAPNNADGRPDGTLYIQTV